MNPYQYQDILTRFRNSIRMLEQRLALYEARTRRLERVHADLLAAARAPVADWTHWTMAVQGLYECMHVDTVEGVREVNEQLAQVRESLASFEREEGPS